MIYDKIKKICGQIGVSIAFVEREAGLRNGTIQNLKKSSPTVDNLKAVANVLGIQIEKLIL